MQYLIHLFLSHCQAENLTQLYMQDVSGGLAVLKEMLC
jgi:hypothetical protein